jgi:hypothetical protein
MDEIRTLCSVDWLSITADYGPETATDNIHIIESKNRSNIFSRVKEIKLTHEKLGVLMYAPYSSILNKSLCMVKFENQILYCDAADIIVTLVIKELQLKNVKISRIDICADFQHTIYVKNPEQLIHDFVNSLIVKIGRSKFVVHGDKTTRNELSYLRFGGHSSMICAYMYNKTKELNEVKDKIYIRQAWKEAGLTEPRDVWRIEFSINPQGECISNELTKEVSRLKWENAFNDNFRREIFASCMVNCFQFRHNNFGIRKIRMKPVPILPEELGIHQIKFRRPKGTSDIGTKRIGGYDENTPPQPKGLNRNRHGTGYLNEA